MKKQKKNSISQKISKAVVLISLFSTLIFGFAGIIGISILNFTVGQMYNQNTQPLRYINQIQSDFANLRLDLSQMVSSNTDNSSECKNLYDDMTGELKKYGKSISSKQELVNYNFIEDNVGNYEDVMNDVISNVQKGDKKAAISAIDSEGSSATVQIEGEINKALSLNNKLAQQRLKLSKIIYIADISFLVLLIFIIMIIAVKRSKHVSKEICSPINKMVTAANSIAKGDFNVDLDIDSNDETAILAGSLKKIVDTFNKMEADVNIQINNVMEGKFDELADSSRHEGDFRKIIDGVNKMLVTIKEPFAVALKFVNNLANGTNQDYIDNTFKGNYAVLVDDLNDVQHSLSILLEESQKLEKAGLDGELDVRGDESRLSGFYAGIIHGVNSTFDAIKNPLDVAAQYISNLTNGIHQADIENTYKGSYAVLIDNLNNVQHSISILLNEEQALTEAGQNGRLDVRGDVSRVKGYYAEIIGGINGILDAISKPLADADSVLKKMAVNDFTVKMPEDNKGMYNGLAVSINMVDDCFLNIEKMLAKLSLGDIGMLEDYKKIGRRSDNDKLIPAGILLMQSLKDLIDVSEKQYISAVEGKLNERADGNKFSGGYREIIHGMNKIMDAFSVPITEASAVLAEFGKGNLTVEMTGEYKGEYNIIKESINHAVKEYNKLLSSINDSASQVASGSQQISDSSQSLSQGAAEQASSVEELTSAIADVAEQTKHNALNAKQASEIAKSEQAIAAKGNEKMELLLNSMREINESSTNISKIIKTIDDIAFQTNILALNAAVEAARAGQYGKGFAVVAEEVRNLAQKSAQASKETTSLIESSIKRVEGSTKIANETAEVLGNIVGGVQKSSDLLAEIANESNEQATAITQIDTGISQVSSVVQTNSATAEEGAASSEELSGQANMLMNMVKQFKFKKIPAGVSDKTDIADNEQPSDIEADNPQIKNEDKFGKY